MAEYKPIYSIPAAAELLECDQTTVYRLIWAGELQTTNIAISPQSKKTKQRILGSSIAAYIDRRTDHGTEAAAQR